MILILQLLVCIKKLAIKLTSIYLEGSLFYFRTAQFYFSNKEKSPERVIFCLNEKEEPMVKKLLTLILVLTFLSVGISYAAEEQPGMSQPSTSETKPSTSEKKAPSKSRRAPGTRVYGMVKEMTDNTLKLTLEKGTSSTTPEEISVVVNDKTKIRGGREVKTTADIKSGEHVMVWYREEGGQKVATSVRILQAKRMKAKEGESMKGGEPKKEESSTGTETGTEQNR